MSNTSPAGKTIPAPSAVIVYPLPREHPEHAPVSLSLEAFHFMPLPPKSGREKKARIPSSPYLIIGFDTEFQTPDSAVTREEIVEGKAKYEVLSYQFHAEGPDVDDLIEGALRLMAAPADVTGPINIGNPNEFTIAELAQAVLRITNSRSELINLPLPQDDPRQRQPDISRANDALGWQPSVQLEEGLRRTAAYFAQQLKLWAAPQKQDIDATPLRRHQS